MNAVEFTANLSTEPILKVPREAAASPPEQPIPDHIADFAVSLCAGTRPGGGIKMIDDYVAFGAGPRGSQNLVLASKARALLQGRTAPILNDLLAVATPILRHRIIVNHRAIGDGVDTTQIIESLIKSTPVPASVRS